LFWCRLLHMLRLLAKQCSVQNTRLHLYCSWAALCAFCCAACKPGFGIEHGQCELCAAGTFSAGGRGATCQLCPQGTRSSPGTSDPLQCTCKPGYGLGDPAEVLFGARVCRECVGGQWSPGGLNAVCQACPGQTTHDKRAATGPDECDKCQPGRPNMSLLHYLLVKPSEPVHVSAKFVTSTACQ
jgi:hypothetical protein